MIRNGGTVNPDNAKEDTEGGDGRILLAWSPEPYIERTYLPRSHGTRSSYQQYLSSPSTHEYYPSKACASASQQCA